MLRNSCCGPGPPERDGGQHQGMVDLAVESALNRVSGVTGHDEDKGGKLRTIEFERIAGGKHFDTSVRWFGEMMEVVGQPWSMN